MAVAMATVSPAAHRPIGKLAVVWNVVSITKSNGGSGDRDGSETKLLSSANLFTVLAHKDADTA